LQRSAFRHHDVYVVHIYHLEFRGANEYDASDIAKAIEMRQPPTYEERLAVFSPTGRPTPSRDPFKR
jgi:hypothetical protein